MQQLDFVDKLETIIERDIDSTLKLERSPKAYENVNWAYKQAHTNGYLKALSNVKKLIDQYKQKQKEERVDRLATTDGADRPYEVIS